MELTSINNIRRLFKEHGFSFTKSLGQNFLTNPAVCPKIAVMGGAEKNTCALEIGTGVGVLTKELAMRCKKVLAVEIDEGLKSVLSETLAEFDNVNVIFGDVLTLNLSELIKEHFDNDAEIICCANLPYYITSPVIMRLLEEKLPLKSITVMVQKEAGERITALPGTRECGAISAAVRYYSEPAKLFSVTRGSFMPAPNVDSVVISLIPHKENPYKISDEKLFFTLIKTAFSQRRKQIINPLSEYFKIPKTELKAALEASGIKSQSRAEELTMYDFVKLYGVFESLIK